MKILATILWACITAAPAITVDEIIDKMEANDKIKSSRVEMTQITHSSRGKKTESHLIAYSKDENDKSMMEYVTPARVKGMKMLSLNDGDDIWIYFPRTGRVRKIASHQKNQSMNNSDFSYEDMSPGDHRDDYDISVAGEEKKSDKLCYKLEMKAKDKKKSYQKIIFWVQKDNFMGLAAEFYDEDLKLWKVLTVSNVIKSGNYWTANNIEMKNVQKGSRTIMRIDKADYDIPVDDKMFSIRELKK